MSLMAPNMGMSDSALNRGVSDESRIVADAQWANQAHLARSATFSKTTAYDGLLKVWEESSAENWDGHGALAVSRATLGHAGRLIDSLPLGTPLPSVGVEPDGQVTLEWYRDPKWTLSVSVSSEGRLFYSALFDSDDPRGSSRFVDQVPRTILDFIKRVTPG